MTEVTRRDFLNLATKGLFLTGVAVATNKLLGTDESRDQTIGVAKFLTAREIADPKKSYLPSHPEQMLAQGATDRIFEKLELDKKFPETINKDVFNVIAQKPARIAALYLQREGRPTEDDFILHCEKFFEKIYDYSNEMSVDFIAVLLMFQISGDANSSLKAEKTDVLDESVRVGLTLAENVAGKNAPSAFVSGLRTLNLGEYYPMARLEGPVTVGIHDIETIMIARGLKNLEKNLPDKWKTFSKTLENEAPEFSKKYKTYLNKYQDFENESKKVVELIFESPEIQEYLQKYQDKEKIEEILKNGQNVDSYQLTRTTVYWATVSELDQLYKTNFYIPYRKNLETEALTKTIQYYQDLKSPTGFFLDQIQNPKILKRLKNDAEVGSSAAKKLLEMSILLNSLSDSLISEDRSIAGSMMKEKTELNLEFQILTGVAYARWLLSEATDSAKIEHFDNPNQLAYTAFLANLPRETGASYTLTATRPLLRATLPFQGLNEAFGIMHMFITEVYEKYENEKPNENFKTFSYYFLNLLEERYFKDITGTRRFKLEGNKKMGDFIKSAEDFGYKRNLITPPHSSAMRAFEATAGYIGEI